MLFTCTSNAGDLVKTELTGQGFIADFYYTDGAPGEMGVLVLGGSEGGKPEYLARPLAARGFPVLALAYFKVPGTPEYLDMIPLEYFDKPIAWLMNHEKTRAGVIAVVGISKGAELALLLASKKAEIRGVIACSPSSVVFQGITKDFFSPRSSWSYGGKPIPFVPYDQSKEFNPNDVLGIYSRSLMQQAEVKKAAIKAERINCPILLFSGEDDKMWPSTQMGDMICERLKEEGFAHKYDHVKYKNAGHTLSEFYMIGGTPQGNKAARMDSTARMMEFLKTLK